MKKEYVAPQMEVVAIKTNQQLLAGSVPGYGGGGSEDPQAPVLEEDWVDKACQFGGWDVEW